VSEEAGSAVVLLVGVLLVRLAATDVYTRYIRPGMGPWLISSGIVLALAGLVGLVRALRSASLATNEVDQHHGHDERVGWLLLAPVAALLMVAPPALGSFGVDRATVAIADTGMTFDPLPPDTTRPMTLLEFDQRSADHHGASFGGTPVELTGFVARTDDAGGFRIARYQIACCAADAVAAVARVVGIDGAPARDSWVTVTGTYQTSEDGIPTLRATGLRPIPAPVDPYE